MRRNRQRKTPSSYEKSGLYEIVAFCDIVRERAEKAKEEYGTEDAKVFEDYKVLIKEDLDVVYVTTPNRSHAEISIAAMEAGKDVMCEKPMAKNYAEAQKMVETAEKTGRVLNIGYQNRYRSDSLYLKEKCARRMNWEKSILRKLTHSEEEQFLPGVYS